MPNSLIDIDQLNNIDRDRLCHDAYRVIDTLQTMGRGQQISSLAVVYLLMCEAFDLNVRWEMERAERILQSRDKQRLPQFQAIRDYIEGELK